MIDVYATRSKDDRARLRGAQVTSDDIIPSTTHGSFDFSATPTLRRGHDQLQVNATQFRDNRDSFVEHPRVLINSTARF